MHRVSVPSEFKIGESEFKIGEMFCNDFPESCIVTFSSSNLIFSDGDSKHVEMNLSVYRQAT
jgi:hypothetical protein